MFQQFLSIFGGYLSYFGVMLATASAQRERLTQTGGLDFLDRCHQERRTFSLIDVANFIAATALVPLTKLEQIFGIVESILSPVRQRSELPVLQAGDHLKYHRVWVPPYFWTDLTLNTMRDDLYWLCETVHDRLAENIVGREFVA